MYHFYSIGSAKGFDFGQPGFPVKCPGELCGGGVALVVNRTFYGVSNTLKGYNQLGDVDK